jgi:hypothetical protein
MERFLECNLVKSTTPKSDELNIDDLTKPLVLSYDNDPSNELAQNLIKSLKLNGWEFMFIGDGIPWKGLITRSEGYAKALSLLHPNKIVVLLDARDLICVRSPNFFIEAMGFITNLPVIVSTEFFCDAKTEVTPTYVGGQCVSLQKYWEYHSITPVRPFLNNGLICGQSYYLKEIFNFVLDKKYQNDQLGVGIFMNTFPQFIYADHKAQLLHTSTFGVNACLQSYVNQSVDSPTFAELMGRGAFFIHVPGANLSAGQKFVYDNIVELVCIKGVSDSHFRSTYPHPEPGLFGYKW